MTHFVCAGGLYQSSKYLWRFKGPQLIFLFCLIDFFSSSNSLNLSSIRPLKSTSSLDSASLGEKSLHSDLKFGHLSDEISGRIPPKTDIGLQHTGKKNSWPTLNFDHLSEDTLKLRWSPKKLRNQNIQEPLKSKRLLPRTLEALKSFWKNLLEKLKKKITKGLANHEIYEKDLDYNSFPHELNEWTEIKLLKPKIIKQQQKALQSDEKVSVQEQRSKKSESLERSKSDLKQESGNIDSITNQGIQNLPIVKIDEEKVKESIIERFREHQKKNPKKKKDDLEKVKEKQEMIFAFVDFIFEALKADEKLLVTAVDDVMESINLFKVKKKLITVKINNSFQAVNNRFHKSNENIVKLYSPYKSWYQMYSDQDGEKKALCNFTLDMIFKLVESGDSWGWAGIGHEEIKSAIEKTTMKARNGKLPQLPETASK